MIFDVVFVSHNLELGGFPAVIPSTTTFFLISVKFDV